MRHGDKLVIVESGCPFRLHLRLLYILGIRLVSPYVFDHLKVGHFSCHLFDVRTPLSRTLVRARTHMHVVPSPLGDGFKFDEIALTNIRNRVK